MRIEIVNLYARIHWGFSDYESRQWNRLVQNLLAKNAYRENRPWDLCY